MTAFSGYIGLPISLGWLDFLPNTQKSNIFVKKTKTNKSEIFKAPCGYCEA